MFRRLLFVAAWLGGAVVVAAQPFALRYTLDDPTPDLGGPSFDGDLFGSSVALRGDLLLVGASAAPTDLLRPGDAHLYEASTGALLRTFNDPTVTAPLSSSGLSDRFGYSVALGDGLALIGAPGHNAGSNNDSGEAHLFNATTGAYLARLSPPGEFTQEALTGRFGDAVALADGLALVGAPGRRVNRQVIGQAYLFDTIGLRRLLTFDEPTPLGLDAFGAAVALDSGRALIGSPARHPNTSEQGQAHLFDTTTGDLLMTFDDPTPTHRDFFGDAVAIDGNLVLIGARGDDTHGSAVGQAHLFDATTGALLRTFDDPNSTGDTVDTFGTAVALENGIAAISSPLDRATEGRSGEVHLFDIATGALIDTLFDPTPTEFDTFGSSVTLNEGRLVVAAQYDATIADNVGQVHVYDPIPEPVSIATALLGLAWSAAVRRRGP